MILEVLKNPEAPDGSPHNKILRIQAQTREDDFALGGLIADLEDNLDRNRVRCSPNASGHPVVTIEI